MARYLIAATPIPGHVTPMLAIAADLVRRGHQVRFLTGAAFAEVVRARGVHHAVLPQAAEVSRIGLPDGLLPELLRRWRTGRIEMRTGFLDPLAAQYHALRAELDRTEFDAVLVDVMFTGAIPLVLDRSARPPVLACGVVPLMLSSADCAPFGVGWQPRADRDYAAMNRFVERVLFRRDQSRLDAILCELGVGPAPLYLLDWPVLADRLLQFTIPGFEYPRGDLPESVVFTGPIPLGGTDAVLPEWWSVLRSGRKVVHMTQGTWDNSDFDQLIRPALRALADRSDVVVVACTGGAPAALGPVPANAYVTDFVPYEQLLPFVDVMITNGGYGGVQQALRHGVPLIVAGDTADKPEIGARVAYTGTGIDLGTARPGSARLAAAVDRVSNSPRYRTAARRMAADMAAYAPFESIAAALAAASSPPAPHRSRPGSTATRNGESL
ncbi:glycosyltransferase [Nocardia sp. XZ_19_385]|uniref:glycosyltransferase n=1 Tax=Nocardia sp. XZ_19_385 TaxID=2769488 RepID=UPI00188F1F0C|nr:nucleotide disphospho-sugar-binding domain-containing protein [Nocardia sp. XZ_19_385]